MRKHLWILVIPAVIVIAVIAWFGNTLTKNGTVSTNSPTSSPAPVGGTTQTGSERTSAASAQIDTPTSGSRVGQEPLVTGHASDIPPGHELWLLVRILGRYHPQSAPLQIQGTGAWSETVFIGKSSGDSGKRFIVHVVIVDTAGGKDLEDYLTKADRDKSFKGLPRSQLPSGTAFLHSVEVVRE